jgi:hypothetical protein
VKLSPEWPQLIISQAEPEFSSEPKVEDHITRDHVKNTDHDSAKKLSGTCIYALEYMYTLIPSLVKSCQIPLPVTLGLKALA